MQVAYCDVPDKAYEVFLNAVTTKYLDQGLVIPSLVEAHNPAGDIAATVSAMLFVLFT